MKSRGVVVRGQPLPGEMDAFESREGHGGIGPRVSRNYLVDVAEKIAFFEEDFNRAAATLAVYPGPCLGIGAAHEDHDNLKCESQIYPL